MTKTTRRPLGRPKTPNPKRAALIRALRAEGLTYAQIGEQVGLSATGVWQVATGYDGYAKRKQR